MFVDCREKNFFQQIITGLLFLGLIVLVLGEIFIKDGSAYATQVYIFLLTPSLLLAVLFNDLNRYTFFKYNLLLLLLAILLWFSLTSLWSDAGGDMIIKTIKYCGYVFLFSASLLYVRQLDSKLHNWCLFVVVVVTIVCVYEFYVNCDLFSVDYRAIRLTGYTGLGGFSHPIIFGNYLSVICIFSYCLLLEVKLKYKPILAVCFILVFYFVLLTGSRGPLLSLLISLSSSLFFYNKKFFWVVLSLLCFVIFFVVFKTSSFDGFINSPSLPEFLDTFFNGRWTTWVGAFDLIEKHPLAGYGAYSNFMVFNPDTGFHAYHPHNGFILMLYETGFIGLLMLVTLLSFTGFILYQNYKSSFAARLGWFLLVLGLCAMISDVHKIISGPHIYWLIIWLPVAIALHFQKKEILVHS